MNLLSSLMLKIALWCNHIAHSGTYASNNQSNNGNNVNGTPSLDVYLYSMNLNASQGNQYVPCAVPDANKLQLWKDQSYGILVMSNGASENEAVPIWENINKRLKNVDLYLDAVMYAVKGIGFGDWQFEDMPFFGVSGVLNLYNATNDTAEETLMYALDIDRKRIVPIPKLIYRIIHGEFKHDDGVQIYEAVVIIHNDPRSKYKIDELDCEQLRSWRVIEDLFDGIGLAYACSPTEEIYEILGIDCSTDANPLELDMIPLYYSEHPGRDRTFPFYLTSGDYRDDIYKRYVHLCEERDVSLIEPY